MELETLVSTRKAATNEKSSDKYSEEPEINHKAYGKNNKKIINRTRKKEKKVGIQNGDHSRNTYNYYIKKIKNVITFF